MKKAKHWYDYLWVYAILIWEGTSEIQRNVIGGQIKKRGVELYTGWAYEE